MPFLLKLGGRKTDAPPELNIYNHLKFQVNCTSITQGRNTEKETLIWQVLHSAAVGPSCLSRAWKDLFGEKFLLGHTVDECEQVSTILKVGRNLYTSIHPTGTFDFQSCYCGWATATVFRQPVTSFKAQMAEKHQPLSLHISYFHQGRMQKRQVLSKEAVPAMQNRHSLLNTVMISSFHCKTQNFHCQELERAHARTHTLGTLFYFAKKKRVFIYKPFHSLSKHSTTIQLFAPSFAQEIPQYKNKVGGRQKKQNSNQFLHVFPRINI